MCCVTQIYFLVIYNSWTPLANRSEDLGKQFILKSLIKKTTCARVSWKLCVLCVCEFCNSNTTAVNTAGFLSVSLSPSVSSKPAVKKKSPPISSHQCFSMNIIFGITDWTLSCSLCFHQRSKPEAENLISFLMFLLPEWQWYKRSILWAHG